MFILYWPLTNSILFLFWVKPVISIGIEKIQFLFRPTQHWLFRQRSWHRCWPPVDFLSPIIIIFCLIHWLLRLHPHKIPNHWMWQQCSLRCAIWSWLRSWRIGCCWWAAAEEKALISTFHPYTSGRGIKEWKVVYFLFHEGFWEKSLKTIIFSYFMVIWFFS